LFDQDESKMHVLSPACFENSGLHWWNRMDGNSVW